MLSKEQVEEIVRLTIQQMDRQPQAAAAAPGPSVPAASGGNAGGRRFADAAQAVVAAAEAFTQFNAMTL